MAQAGRPTGVFARVIDTSQADAALAWLFVLFVLGNLAGTLLLGLPLLRSNVVAAWAAVAVLAWPVLYVTALVAGSEWIEAAGAAQQAAGLAAAGVAVLLRRAGGWPRQNAARGRP